MKTLKDTKAYKEFIAAVFESLLWSSTDDNGDSLDSCTRDDIAADQQEEIEAHASSFFFRTWFYVDYEKGKTYGDLGHDFVMTINGHGVGFWEKSDWPIYHEFLTKVAKCYPAIESVCIGENLYELLE